MYKCYDCLQYKKCKSNAIDPACDRFQPKGVKIMTTKKTETTKKTTKKAATKKETKEQTVILTIQATYILKDGKPIDPEKMIIDLNVCPGADKVDIKKIQVFERE